MQVFNHIPLITVLTGNNLIHSSCVVSERITTKYYFFRSQLLTKTHVLKPSKVRGLNTAFLAYLSEVGLSHLTVTGHLLRKVKSLKSINTSVATATVATFATVEPSKHCHTKNSTTVLLVALLASCQPSYAEVGKSHFGGNSDFVQELNKINQLPVFDSFNCIDKVAVTSNNVVLSKSHSVSPQRHIPIQPEGVGCMRV